MCIIYVYVYICDNICMYLKRSLNNNVHPFICSWRRNRFGSVGFGFRTAFVRWRRAWPSMWKATPMRARDLASGKKSKKNLEKNGDSMLNYSKGSNDDLIP